MKQKLITLQPIYIKAYTMKNPKEITLIVSGNTTVSYEELTENADYGDQILDLLQHDVPFNQCVDHLTNWVNSNY
jgi:hypothetical protein